MTTTICKASLTVVRCRAVLELAWPLMRDCGSIPPLDLNAQALSDRCCIHAAGFLAAVLNEAAPELTWRIVGGHPTENHPRGGYEGVQHLWVEGFSPEHGSWLADVTADQFGGPRVLFERQPVPCYLPNTDGKSVEAIVDCERDVVGLLMELYRTTLHLMMMRTRRPLSTNRHGSTQIHWRMLMPRPSAPEAPGARPSRAAYPRTPG